MKTYARKNTLNILKVKVLKISACCIRQSPIQINIPCCHCLTYIPILTTGTLHGEVQPGQTFKKIYSQLKHAIRILPSKDRSTHTRELFKECKVLNVYQVNIWKNLVFMHQVNSNTVPTIFLNKFKKPTHNYPTNFARTNYSIPPFKLNKSKYRISIRGSTLWKNIPTDTEKK